MSQVCYNFRLQSVFVIHFNDENFNIMHKNIQCESIFKIMLDNKSDKGPFIQLIPLQQTTCYNVSLIGGHIYDKSNFQENI